MSALHILGGVMLAGSVYLLLDGAAWRRLNGFALLGPALALLVAASGGGAPSALRIAIALALMAFAQFLAAASFVLLRRRVRSVPPAGGMASQ